MHTFQDVPQFSLVSSVIYAVKDFWQLFDGLLAEKPEMSHLHTDDRNSKLYCNQRTCEESAIAPKHKHESSFWKLVTGLWKRVRQNLILDIFMGEMREDLITQESLANVGMHLKEHTHR
jgi:hypothetical protein